MIQKSTKHGGTANLIRLLLVVGATTFTQQTLAENWKAVDGTNLYVDLDTRKRNGDVAEIKVRGIHPYPVLWEFDCIRWRVLNDENSAIPKNSLWDAVGKIACKRTWEVWK